MRAVLGIIGRRIKHGDALGQQKIVETVHIGLVPGLERQVVQAGAKAVMAGGFFFGCGFLDADNQVGVMEAVVMRMDELAKAQRAQNFFIKG